MALGMVAVFFVRSNSNEQLVVYIDNGDQNSQPSTTEPQDTVEEEVIVNADPEPQPEPEIEQEPTTPTEPEIDPIPEPEPEVTETKTYIEFGKPDEEYDFIWPDENALLLVDKDASDWRLSQINYMTKYNQFSLSSIQFVFMNGVVSPPCAANRIREDDKL